MECPKCHAENRDDSRFCSNCAAPLSPTGTDEASLTKTVVTPLPAISKNALVAGKYKIIEELGRGGMGIVYKAEDIRLQRTVALKFLPPELVHIPEIKDRFRQEAKAAAALDHPNICTIYDFDQAEDRAFISMAYIEGQSLRKRIDSGPLELEEALRIAVQVAEGLQEAHKRGIVHRDIKSANVMVTERGQAKVMDFGLARVAGATLVTREGTTMGTVTYMSPEQARGDKVDQRTDIWSFGVVLYEMLTGELPFKGEHEQAIIHSILKEEPKPLRDLRADIPPSIEQVVFRAFEKDPDRRYQRIDDLLDDLKSIAAGIVPDEIQVRLRREKLRKRKRTFLYGGAAGLTMAAVVIALILISGPAEAIDSVAVLPLENRTGDAAQQYYVDGITEDLINHLGKISGFRRVVSRTTMMRYKDTDKSLPEIARELKVGALVEGTVHEVGKNVRLQLQVFDPEERTLLAETYERTATDIRMMYGEIARAMAGRLHVKLTAEEETRLVKARQVNTEAYNLWLLGNYTIRYTAADLDAAMRYYELALEKDPNFAPAYVGISGVWLVRQQMGFTLSSEAGPKAKAALRRALELDETLLDARNAIAAILTWTDWDWEAAGREWVKSIELDPNNSGHRASYSHYLMIVGRPEEAMRQIERAVELEPVTPPASFYAAVLYMAHRYDDSIVQARRALRLDPHDNVALNILFLALHESGQHDEAIKAAIRYYACWLPDALDIREALERGYAEEGYAGAWRRLADIQVSRHVEVPGIAWDVASNNYMLAGDTAKALDWLEKAIAQRDPNAPYANCQPNWDPVRSDPRFQELLRRMNLPTDAKK
jgi:TolB-like protein/tetratricopeptide (TPR) repeat protein/predicted Ser/Thr protein kinase